jgi:peptidoglycan hydrolase-like protein with peptidoglycan-binding domain
MRAWLQQRSLNGWLLVTLAAGSCRVPAAAAQNSTTGAVHKSTAASSAPAASESAPAQAPKNSTTKSSAPKGSTVRKATKSSGKRSAKKGSSRHVEGQAAPTPERIDEIQQALTRSGAYAEAPSGKWDDSTVEAMKKFQSEHGLTPTGKLDALTLQKLGFGSDTAGLAAPTPPPDAAANRLLSRSGQREEIKGENEAQPQ